MDTGAGATLLTSDTAEAIGKPLSADPLEIVYAGGDRGQSNKAVNLAGEPAYVVDNLQDNLFSPAHLIDEGFTLHLDKSGGVLSNPDSLITIPIHRDRGSWRLWINDLVTLPTDPRKTYTAKATYAASFIQNFQKTMQSRQKINFRRKEVQRRSAPPHCSCFIPFIIGRAPAWIF